MRYTQDEKNEVLACLDFNQGDVQLASQLMGVPERTIYAWKRERKLQRQAVSAAVQQEKKASPQQYTAANPQLDLNTPEAMYTHIRNRLVSHINTLLDHLMDDPDTAHLRIMALSRLLDRVIKLEAYAASEVREHTVTIEYQYADGTIHDVPPWQHPDYSYSDEDLSFGGKKPITTEDLYQLDPSLRPDYDDADAFE